MKPSHIHPRRGTRSLAVFGGIALALAGFSSPAPAPVACTNTTPSLNELVTCSATADLTVPTGARTAFVTVNGAGGGAGAGGGSGTGGAGGSGAQVIATLNVDSLSTLRVVVGNGGAAGGASSAGGGGGYSAVYQGASSAVGDVLVVAGGGGGGQAVTSGSGVAGGSAAALNTAAGGVGALYGPNGVAAAGADGSGAGGVAGTYLCATAGNAGQSWVAGGAGGVGGNDGSAYGGGGGDGYGGGGGGSSLGSGGGGGSFALSARQVGVAAFSPAGGVGGLFVAGPDVGLVGADGSLSITFSAQLASTSSVVPTGGISWRGSDSHSQQSVAQLNTWVQTPTTATAPHDGLHLLGWASYADFPVELAQRQVDRGWGAYEMFNEDGSIRGVFIPSGGYAFFTNDLTFHAIWGTQSLIGRC